MGIGNTIIGLLGRLRIDGQIPRRATVIEIGAQQLTNGFLTAPDELASLGHLFGITTLPPLPPPLPTHVLPSGQEALPEHAPHAREFWAWLGFDYASIDIDGSPGSIPLDLNYDHAPEAVRGRYDLVTNFGTTEHVANQLNAFELIHDLVAPGGIMIHELPVYGYANHGLVNYNFKFFWMLARSNHYKFIDAHFSRELEEDLPNDIVEFLSEFEQGSPGTFRLTSAGLRVVLQKRFDIPFVPPIDVNTGTTTEYEVLRQRYWTVFAPEGINGLVDHARSARSARPENVLPQTRVPERAVSVELDDDANLPFPAIDISDGDAISAITATAEFQRCAEIIKSRGLGDISLMSEHSQALLYCTIRLVRPKLVIEIGTYRAGTSKVIAWALAANGCGMLHTVDPFGKSRVPSILASWPAHLRNIVSFYPVNSMEYFGGITETGKRSELIFVDGNHDYEFASFDIESAARVATPKGFIFVDNTSQAGPFLAAQDFVKRNPGWVECGGNSINHPIIDAPFERRSPIYATDFCVLRGPAVTAITSRPYTPGQLRWEHPSLKGIRVRVTGGPPGKLHVQCVVRTFGDSTALGEYQIGRSVEIQHAGEITVELAFEHDEKADTEVVHTLIEPWFVWVGKNPLMVDNWTLM